MIEHFSSHDPEMSQEEPDINGPDDVGRYVDPELRARIKRTVMAQIRADRANRLRESSRQSVSSPPESSDM